MFELFKRRCPRLVDASSMETLDLLAVAQHHGVPTRLLDWTSNPLVAAYFAVVAAPGTQSAKLVDAHGRAFGDPIQVVPDKRLVPARIVATRVHSRMTLQPQQDPFDLDKVSFFWPRLVADRITDQSGLFSVHPEPDADWETPLAASDDIFEVPGEMRAFFQKRLFYLGIDPQRIMGGLDGIGARLSWQYFARTGLGTY